MTKRSLLRVLNYKKLMVVKKNFFMMRKMFEKNPKYPVLPER